MGKRPRVLNDENTTLEIKAKIQQEESENVILKNKLEKKNLRNKEDVMAFF